MAAKDGPKTPSCAQARARRLARLASAVQEPDALTPQRLAKRRRGDPGAACTAKPSKAFDDATSKHLASDHATSKHLESDHKEARADPHANAMEKCEAFEAEQNSREFYFPVEQKSRKFSFPGPSLAEQLGTKRREADGASAAAVERTFATISAIVNQRPRARSRAVEQRRVTAAAPRTAPPKAFAPANSKDPEAAVETEVNSHANSMGHVEAFEASPTSLKFSFPGPSLAEELGANNQRIYIHQSDVNFVRRANSAALAQLAAQMASVVRVAEPSKR